MRAVSYAQFGGPEVLHVVTDMPMPQPGQDRCEYVAPRPSYTGLIL